MSAPDLPPKRPSQAKTKSETGFTAGTLVHTQKGLMPIEQVRASDLVLSKSKNGKGEQAYKFVVKTLIHEAETIREISYQSQKTDKNEVSVIYTTDQHQFFVEKLGWTSAQKLSVGNIFAMADGSLSSVTGNTSVYKTKQPHVGLIPHQKNSNTASAKNFLTGEILQESIPCKTDLLHGDEWLLKTRIYTLEVAHSHNYYVGDGILVSDIHETVPDNLQAPANKNKTGMEGTGKLKCGKCGFTIFNRLYPKCEACGHPVSNLVKTEETQGQTSPGSPVADSDTTNGDMPISKNDDFILKPEINNRKSPSYWIPDPAEPLSPIKSTPLLFTLNGIGQKLYGYSDYDAKTHSYMATLYLVFMFIPIIPRARYRVSTDDDKEFYFLGQAKLRSSEKIHLYILVIMMSLIFIKALIANYLHKS